MKLTRKQELRLIELGFTKLLDQLEPSTKKIKEPKSKGKPHWTQTASGKKKMAKSMKEMWAKRRNKV